MNQVIKDSMMTKEYFFFSYQGLYFNAGNLCCCKQS